MNTDISTTENIPAPGDDDKVQPAKRGNGLSALALILALVALSGAAWLWWRDSGEAQRDSQQQLAAGMSRQAEMLADLNAREDSLETRLAALAGADPGERLSALEQTVGALERSSEAWQSFQQQTATQTRSMQAVIDSLESRLAGAESKLAAMSVRTVNSSAELDLAEIDYLLRLAQERLALFADTRMADRALEIADRYLSAFDNPRFIGLQRDIAAAREKLALQSTPDYQALIRKLESLQSGLGSLSFKGEAVVARPAAGAAGSNWWTRIRNAFSSLVTVRRTTGAEKAYPVLADRELIRQRAWLALEVAKLAAMRRDKANYAAALKQFSDTLERWFEPSDPDIPGIEELLHEAQSVDVDPPLPDISAPWTALRAIRAAGISMPSRRAPSPPPESRQEPAPQPEAKQNSPEPDSGGKEAAL